MLPYPQTALGCGHLDTSYSEDELAMITELQNKKLTTKHRYPVESILAFLPLRVKYQAWNNVAHLKKLLQRDYELMRAWDTTGMHKRLLHTLVEGLQGVSFANSRSQAVAIYVSANDQKMCYLRYPLKTTLVYNKPLCVTSIPYFENNVARQYIAITFNNAYLTVYMGSGDSLNAVSRLSVSNSDTYIKNIDRLLDSYLANKTTPVFALGLPDMVSHFVEFTVWQFNIADTFLTEIDIKAPFIAVFLGLWVKQCLPCAIHDEGHVPG